MVRLRVEAQGVAGAGVAVHAGPLAQLGVVLVRGHAHVAVAEHDHGLVVVVVNIHVRVVGQAGGPVAAGQLDVVVVVVQGKGALEQRVQAVAADADARPADIVPAAAALRPGGALEDLVLAAVDGLLAMHAAVGGQVCDAPAGDKQVVVRLEAEADALGAHVKGDVERRHGRHPVVRRQDVGMGGVGNGPQRRAVRRRGGGEGRRRREKRNDGREGAEEVHPRWCCCCCWRWAVRCVRLWRRVDSRRRAGRGRGRLGDSQTTTRAAAVSNGARKRKYGQKVKVSDIGGV